jgi:hypothetical protein
VCLNKVFTRWNKLISTCSSCWLQLKTLGERYKAIIRKLKHGERKVDSELRVIVQINTLKEIAPFSLDASAVETIRWSPSNMLSLHKVREWERLLRGGSRGKDQT